MLTTISSAFSLVFPLARLVYSMWRDESIDQSAMVSEWSVGSTHFKGYSVGAARLFYFRPVLFPSMPLVVYVRRLLSFP